MTTPNEETNPTENNQGHPAWQEILDVVPEEFHGLLTPKLKAWDDGVSNKLQSVQSEVEPFKELLDAGLSPEQIKGAVDFGRMFNEDPATVIQKAIEHYKIDLNALGFNTGQGEGGDGSPSDDELDDLAERYKDDPVIQSIIESQRGLEERFETKEQEEEASAAQQEAERALDEYLETLTEEYGEYDETYVLAMMQAGMDGEEAVKQFQQISPNYTSGESENSDGDQAGSSASQTPVIAGGSGNVGTGVPNPSNKLGDLKPNAVSDLVSQYLAQADKE